MIQGLEKLKRIINSLSLKVRNLIREALESYENIHWTKIAESREKTFSNKKALSHKQVMNRSRKKGL